MVKRCIGFDVAGGVSWTGIGSRVFAGEYIYPSPKLESFLLELRLRRAPAAADVGTTM